MEITHVGSLSHKLHLDVQYMINSEREIRKCIISINNTMVDCKSKLLNRAVLRNLTSLPPVLLNSTQWTSTYEMIIRFSRIRSELVATGNRENASVRINSSTYFKEKIQTYEN